MTQAKENFEAQLRNDLDSMEVDDNKDLDRAKMIEMENFMNNLIAADDSSTEEEPELSQAELEELPGNLSSDSSEPRGLEAPDKMLAWMRKARGIDEDSGAHAIDKAFTEKGVDHSACFNNSFVGPRIRKMLESRKEIVQQQEEGLLKVLKRSQDSNQRDAASETEVKEKMEFFGDILHC
jgi:hypothetical protein